jgi:hypothetical protein
VTPELAIEAADRAKLLRRIRILVSLFMIGLVLSGLTAFPLVWETALLAKWLGASATSSPDEFTGLTWWIVTVRDALRETDIKYPFLAYGTDWLAFAHLMIATAFIGVLRDPVRNIWIIEWALICCAATIPVILVCGPISGIPLGWQVIDASFGVVGCVPLLLCRRDIKELACRK